MHQRLYAEIDLKAIASNIQLIRKLTAPNAKIMAVVKADAYGHGIIPVSRTVIENGADYLGVAICEEGIELRKYGLECPIVILGYTPRHLLEQVIKNDLNQTVYTYEAGELLSKTARRLAKVADINIKIDTGMSRLGFLPNNDSISDIVAISELPALNIAGFFTHFAVADEEDLSFTEHQLTQFSDFMQKLEACGIRPPMCHCSNSAGLLDGERFHLDMVRPGILIYGLPPSKQFDVEALGFKSVMSLKSQVSLVKSIDKGTSVSYGRRFYAKRPTIAATVPAGYADGYARCMSNGGQVLIHGSYAPVIGTVTMDQFIADVTDIPDVRIGDEVVLMGRQGENRITADDIAGLRATINYEVICGIGKRVPRKYSL